jgi:hypothetical protein
MTEIDITDIEIDQVMLKTLVDIYDMDISGLQFKYNNIIVGNYLTRMSDIQNDDPIKVTMINRYVNPMSSKRPYKYIIDDGRHRVVKHIINGKQKILAIVKNK